MKLRSTLILALACGVPLFTPPGRAENEIGFVEKFALAPDRGAVLDQLVPGTEDYYYYHALHYQNTRQKAKLATLLSDWSKRFPSSEQRRVIQNREALLAYSTEPKATLKYLRDQLNLQFDHERQARDERPDLPTKLDPAEISRATFQQQALDGVDDLSNVEDEALPALLRNKAALSPSQTRDLLKKLTRPDVPGLVNLIAADLQNKESGGFGEFEIHAALLPQQLDELAKRVPSLLRDEQFVTARLRKMAPISEVDLQTDLAERTAWLDRLWAYVKKLDGSFNSLKAQILAQRLQVDRSRGIYDKALFKEYIKLPRHTENTNLEALNRAEQASVAAELNEDGKDLFGDLPLIVSDDNELVRDYALHLLKDEPSWEPWAAWLRDTWLKPVFAEAKLVNGIGDPNEWAALLSPAEFQELKDRVDLDFPGTNPIVYAPGDEVNLDLFLKNAPKVLVKIYEINTLSFFLTNQRPLNVDLALDGLVANREMTLDFSADEAGRNPLRRALRTFKFPELKGRRGAWVIEFIGGGKSSRALVNKGGWSLLQRVSPAGDMITVLDETQQPVKDATVWLEGRKLTADAKTGAIIVPFTQQPGTKQIILADAAGEFATLAYFEHHGENYELSAQIHVEREQLLAGREATIAVRTALISNNEPMPLELLQEPKLVLTSTTLDDVTTTTEVKIDKLEAAKVFTHAIKVPDRLKSLDVVLQAKVAKISAGGEKQDLEATQNFTINGIDKTQQVQTGNLSRFGNDYVFELLGKNGEPIPDRAVNFEFTHRDFTTTIDVSLRTDEKGRIDCGGLAEIATVEIEIPTGEGDNTKQYHWTLQTADRTWPSVIHAAAGDEIQVPWTSDSPPTLISLLEQRAETYVADRTAAVTLASNGEAAHAGKGLKSAVSALVLHGLTAGDYELKVAGRDAVPIHVTAGHLVQNWVISRNRELEIRDATPLNITRITKEAGTLVVSLANAGKFTRVHVAATRFLPEATLFTALGGFNRVDPAEGKLAHPQNLFAVGREIGDEYRYILDRRYSKHYPGNMLPRPGLLMDPWEIRSTDLQAQRLKAQKNFPHQPGINEPMLPQSPTGNGEMKETKAVVEDEEGPNLDFLAQAAPVIYNLVPDEKGIVRIDLKALGDRQYIQVYAEDLHNAAWRTVPLAEVPTKFQDLRLTRNLNPQKPFAEKKEVTVLAAGQTLTLGDMQTAELETYDSLNRVFTLFKTLDEDNAEKLAKFSWIIEWPKLSEEDKRAKYSEFASHEVNFFLSRKDPGFFQKVVAPYLRNKKDRTFMDDYLLGNDLRRYFEPWAFDRLNAAERCLLARRLPAESTGLARHERELWELLPPDVEGADRLFETALHGQAMNTEASDFQREKAQGGGGLAAPAAMPALTAGNRSGTTAISANAIDALLFPAAPVEKNKATAQDAAPALKPAIGAISGVFTDPQFAVVYAGGQVKARVKLTESAKREEASAAAAPAPTPASLAAAAPVDTPMSPEAVEGMQEQREQVRQFFRALGPAKEWAENNYYQLPLAEQNADLIPVNAFWRDYAAWDGKSPFISANVAEAGRSFTEVMLALAVLDLPFESPKHTTRSADGQYTLTAAGPLIAYHKEIKPATPAAEQAPLLVSQNFFRADDRYREEGNEKFEKYVTDEFLSGVVYGANVVVTNPTSSKQEVSVLLQIPRGALPVNGSKATDSRPLEAGPYSTQTLEYYFYFPAPAAQPLPHYPVHVSREEQIVGEAKPSTFKVVHQLTQMDKTSWDYVSQYATDAEVFAFLDKANIERVDLERVAWRARKSVEFFQKLVGVMEKRHVYSEPIYRYSIAHNAAGPLATWLRNRGDFLEQCGPYLDSKLIKINPIERRDYEHLEYSPLINQRAHRVGAENAISNAVFRAQYQHLLEILAHKATLDAVDQMSVVYYLFLQDRIEEALARFHAIAPEALPTRLQHDYFRCYAAFYEEQPAVARGIAQQYADYPVDRWRKLFAEVSAQLDEIEGKQAVRPGDKEPNRDKQQGELAATEPSFDFKVENRQIALTWKNLKEVTIRYYLMDPEFLFSASPFVTENSGRFSIIKATRTDTQALPEGKDQLAIPLPLEFTKANVLVEVLGAGQRKAQTYHANTLKLAIAENYGRLEARDATENKAVSKAYVKVYARLKNGTVRFFKDGYTDLRGRFDYASLNSSESSGGPVPSRHAGGDAGDGMNYQMLSPGELKEVDRFAILLMSEAHGADVREAGPRSE